MLINACGDGMAWAIKVGGLSMIWFCIFDGLNFPENEVKNNTYFRYTRLASRTGAIRLARRYAQAKANRHVKKNNLEISKCKVYLSDRQAEFTFYTN